MPDHVSKGDREDAQHAILLAWDPGGMGTAGQCMQSRIAVDVLIAAGWRPPDVAALVRREAPKTTLHVALTRGIEKALRDFGADLTGCTPAALSGHIIKELRDARLHPRVADRRDADTQRPPISSLTGEPCKHAADKRCVECIEDGGFHFMALGGGER